MNTKDFACYELNRYASQMGICLNVDIKVDESAFDTTQFEKYDAFFDDAFIIDVHDGKGTILGTNERSLLLGVYHFFKKQGCRFLKPGNDGEYIPYTGSAVDVSETWYAALRHRGTTSACWGGGRGLCDMLDYIDWMPKMMMNSFFIELTDYYGDVCAAFKNTDNPYKTKEFLSRETFNIYDRHIVEETRKRGLIRHGAGHGWTVELMDGVDEIIRDVDNSICTNPEILAEIEGERKFFKRKSVFTNLCYSQDVVRKKWAEAVYAYSLEHPEVDVIHVWLADYFNNFCECENCRKLTQSDWYVKLLNDIDDEFTKHGSDKKLSFLIYFELAYPPIKERIHNEDRFIMMFAPYGRDFTKTYKECPPVQYERKPHNKFSWKDMRMDYYLKQLSEWQEVFKGDSFVFDYSLFERASLCEITDVLYAPIPHEDCLRLKEYGLNGRIDCSNTKAMTPTSLSYHAMFEAMFYKKESYEEIERDYFTSCYGKGESIREFLHRIGTLLPREYMLLHTSKLTETDKENLSNGLAIVRSFREQFRSYVPDDTAHMKNCWYFAQYLEILEFVFYVLYRKADGISQKELDECIEEYRHLIFRKEEIMPNYIKGTFWFTHIKSVFTATDQYEQF